MATVYTHPTEASLASDEHSLAFLDAMKAILVEVADAGLLVSAGSGPTRRVKKDRVFVSGQKLPTHFPAIRIEEGTTREQYWTMGATGSGERRLDYECRVTVMDKITGNSELASRSTAKLSDRVRQVLSHDRELNGLVEDLLVTSVRKGMFNPQGDFTMAGQMTVTAWQIVDTVGT
jgi:hypothetical protein